MFVVATPAASVGGENRSCLCEPHGHQLLDESGSPMSWDQGIKASGCVMYGAWERGVKGRMLGEYIMVDTTTPSTRSQTFEKKTCYWRTMNV